MSALAVGSKLLGIYLFYAGLTYVLTSVVLAQEGGPVVLLQLLGAAIAFAFGWFLTFRTERVTRLVGATRSEGGAEVRRDPHELLRTGVVLIGLYVFVTRIGGALRDFGFWAGGHLGGIGGAPVQVLIELVPVILAALFVFRPGLIVNLTAGKPDEHRERVAMKDTHGA